MLEMTKYTGTKTVKACPMSLGEAEKVLGRKIVVFHRRPALNESIFRKLRTNYAIQSKI